MSTDGLQIVVAHSERATLRVGEVFLKVDTDPLRTDREVEAMSLAPVPTPAVLWRQPPVLALAAVPGVALGQLGTPSSASGAAWRSAGAIVRRLHEAPRPPWAGPGPAEFAARLDAACEWLLHDEVLPADLVVRNRQIAEAALRSWAGVFTHGDLQASHVLVVGDEVAGVLDWSEAGAGDAMYDLAVLSMGQEDRLGDLLAGYGADVDVEVIRAWWSLRSLIAIRWLTEHGFDPFLPGCEVDVLRARM